MPEQVAASEVCSRPGRVDGTRHSWRFWGDDPYIECVFCNELRDALTGRVVRAATEGETDGNA